MSAPPATDGDREVAVMPLMSDNKRDALGEIVNIGMGVAGSALAQVLDAFVELNGVSFKSQASQDYLCLSASGG